MPDNGSIVARCTSKSTTVTNFLLDVTDNGTLRALAYRKNVADSKCSFFASVDESTRVETFSCNESFFPEFVAVGITENNTGKGSTTGLFGVGSLYWKYKNHY